MAMTTKLKTTFYSRANPIATIFETIESSILINIPFHIAGGAAFKLYRNLPLNDSDIDLWFNSKEDLDRAIQTWKDSLVDKEQLTLLVITDNSHTYYCSDCRFDRCFKVQFIAKCFNEDIETTIRAFDFTVCQVAYKHGRLYLTPEAYRDNRDKVLRLATSYDREICHTRLRKYVMLGFTPTIDLFDTAFIHNRTTMQTGDLNLNNSEFYEQ